MSVSLAIYLELERMGFKAWYDNRADDLTKEGMLKGIEQAAAFVLFLSTGVLERPYCQMEIRHALALKKPVVLLHGERHMALLMRAAGCARAQSSDGCLSARCPSPTSAARKSSFAQCVLCVWEGIAAADAG